MHRIGPFGHANLALKKDMVDVLVPTLNHVKRKHDQVANGPDLRFQ
jgi:hypothetical protein